MKLVLETLCVDKGPFVSGAVERLQASLVQLSLVVGQTCFDGSRTVLSHHSRRGNFGSLCFLCLSLGGLGLEKTTTYNSSFLRRCRVPDLYLRLLLSVRSVWPLSISFA